MIFSFGNQSGAFSSKPHLICRTGIVLHLVLLNALLASAQLLPNAGFESGYAGWVASQGSGTAGFSTPNTYHYVGSRCAQVTVNNPGSPNFPSLSTTFNASASETYLLRWFGRASVNRAGMKIHVSSSGGPAYAPAAFNPSANGWTNSAGKAIDGWEGYHFAFKASGMTTVKITFEQSATYLLDEVQIFDTKNGLDHTGTRMDPERHFLWRWGQGTNQPGRLMNTDNNLSVPLPDGRVVWLYNDTYTGAFNPYNNSGGTAGFVRNFLVVQNGQTLTPWTPGKTSFEPPTSGNWYWPNDAFVLGDKLKIIHHEVTSSTGYGAFVGSVIATLSLPGLTLDNITAHTPWNINKVVDGADGFLYIIGGLNGAGDHGIARVEKFNFDNLAAWRYWNGTAWVAESAGWVALPNLDGLWTMARIGPNNFVAVSGGFVGSSWRASFAPSPLGPWTNPEHNKIGYPPIDFETETSFYYMPCLHKDTVQNGVYSVGFSDIGPDGADGANIFLSNRPARDQCFYNIQYFLTPNLLTLSPYTTPSFTDSFDDNDPVEWKTYGGTWTASAGQYSVLAGNDGAESVALGVVNDSVVVETDVAVTGANAGVFVRGSDYGAGPSNFRGYYAGLVPEGGVFLARMDKGTRTVLATGAASISSGAGHHLKLTASGDRIEVFVDNLGSPKISISDTNYTIGTSGLCAFNATASFDNFTVIDTPKPPSPPVVHLRFDESSGTTAADCSGNGWNGVLHNQATWMQGCVSNAVAFDGDEDYVTLGQGLLSELRDFTITTWVKWNGGSAWQRVWDFGTGTDKYILLTPRNGAGKASFEITVNGGAGKQVIEAPAALPAGVWTHVAVSLSNTVGTLYLNGSAVGSRSITLTPSSLGVTTQNYLGKSQYGNDAELNGSLDEFQIYDRAVSASELAALLTPTLSIHASGPNQIQISWTPNSGGWTLQEASQASPDTWTDSATGGTNPIVISATGPTRFFRLIKPGLN